MKGSQLCPILCDPMDYMVRGILQARILEWVAIPFSRGSSQSRYQTQVSRTAGGFFTSSATIMILECLHAPTCGAACYTSIVSSTLTTEIISLILEITRQSWEGTHAFFKAEPLQFLMAKVYSHPCLSNLSQPPSAVTLYHLCFSSRGSHSGHLEYLGPFSGFLHSRLG